MRDAAGRPIADAQVWQNPGIALGGGHRGLYSRRVGTTDGEGAARVLLPSTLFPGRGAGRFGLDRPATKTAADGRFEFHGVTDAGFRIVTPCGPDRLRSLGVRLPPGRSAAPLVWLAAGAPPIATDKPIELGDLRLAALHVADLRVRNHDKTPAEHAVVLVKGGFGYQSPMRYRTDRVGHPGDAEQELILSRPATVRGVVVDAAGRPIAGATVRSSSRPMGVDRHLANLAFEARSSVQTDARGRFEIRVPFGDATFTLWGSSTSGQTLLSSWLHVDVRPDGGSAAVRIRLTEARRGR